MKHIDNYMTILFKDDEDNWTTIGIIENATPYRISFIVTNHLATIGYDIDNTDDFEEWVEQITDDLYVNFEYTNPEINISYKLESAPFFQKK
jgi:hypothetical protein